LGPAKADPKDPSNWGEYSEDQDGFMKRQRGRGRKPGGGGGGGGSHNHGNRSLESNGPDVKIRGTAAQIYEKYSQFARDAQSAGDRVKYENLMQHAEHYFRIMVATMPRDRLFQPTGEGGMPMQPQGYQQAGEGQQQVVEGGMPAGGEGGDPLKVMDDQAGGDDGDYDDDRDGGDDDRDAGGDDLEAGGGDDQRQQDNQQQGDQQGDRQGRRRRRGRRRHHEGDRNTPQQSAGNQNNSNGGDGGSEPRSALDSLARRQGAIAGD
jgi:hypothetical protein